MLPCISDEAEGHLSRFENQIADRYIIMDPPCGRDRLSTEGETKARPRGFEPLAFPSSSPATEIPAEEIFRTSDGLFGESHYRLFRGHSPQEDPLWSGSQRSIDLEGYCPARKAVLEEVARKDGRPVSPSEISGLSSVLGQVFDSVAREQELDIKGVATSEMHVVVQDQPKHLPGMRKGWRLLFRDEDVERFIAARGLDAHPALLTTAQVAERFAVDAATVRRWQREGKFNGGRAGKDWRFEAEGLPSSVASPSSRWDELRSRDDEVLAHGEEAGKERPRED